MLIDTHVHIFPDNIAHSALEKLSDSARIVPSTDGTFFGTLKNMDEWGVSEFWLQSVATNAKQLQKVNDFAASLASEKVLAFGSLFPRAVELSLSELARLKEMGIKGVKFHPEYQQFDAADESYFPLYEFMEKNNMAALFHAGKDSAYPESENAHPAKLKIVHDTFPKLKMILAHLGGWCRWDEVIELLVNTDIYFDTAAVAGYISERQLKEIFRLHDIERFLFATDAPWSTPEHELDLIKTIGLNGADMERICYKNAQQLRAQIGA
jgi:predicted TIM-barrel fold metal-dependent hydrolase